VLPAEAPQPGRDAERPARSLNPRAALAATLAGAAIFAAAGCGDDDDSTTEPAGPDTALRISLDLDGPGGKAPREAEVVCEPGMDTGPCERIAELDVADLAPVPPTQPCTEIYGGPATATITGTLHGEAVNAALSKQNGCEIERYARVEPLLAEVFRERS
jgi:hypothetical protein